jgi:surface antigen
MLDWGFGFRVMALGVGIAAICPLAATQAHAAKPHVDTTKSAPLAKSAPISKSVTIVKISSHSQITSKSSLYLSNGTAARHVMMKGGKTRYVSGGYRTGGISCVPFARVASGIVLKGNAANWWDAANGVYARGQAPEGGSVLNFRANGHMRLGHVAVVTRVIDSRQIEIDHANWAGPGANKGGVSRSVPVIDVSANNDWSAVRVGLDRHGDFGSVYPTYGFIYDRPDSGYASARATTSYDEVAEAPVRSFR